MCGRYVDVNNSVESESSGDYAGVCLYVFYCFYFKQMALVFIV